MSLRRWLHRRGWLLSPSTAFSDAYQASDPARLLVCQSCMDGFGRRHDCDADRYCDCDDTGHHASSPVVIHWVQRSEMPKIPTFISFCCREYIAPYGIPGGRCEFCGERPTFWREDPDSPHLAAAAELAGADPEPPRERERIVVRSAP